MLDSLNWTEYSQTERGKYALRPAMLVDLKDFSAVQSAVDDVAPPNAPTLTTSQTHTRQKQATTCVSLAHGCLQPQPPLLWQTSIESCSLRGWGTGKTGAAAGMKQCVQTLNCRLVICIILFLFLIFFKFLCSCVYCCYYIKPVHLSHSLNLIET